MDPKTINVHQYLLTKGRGGKKQATGGPAAGQAGQKVVKQQAPRDVTNVVRNNSGSATPAIVKRKQIMKQPGFISSPTDTVLSPCSQKLWKREPPAMANVAKFDLANASLDDEVMEQEEAPRVVASE